MVEYTKAEAELDAKREAAEDRIQKEVQLTIANPRDLFWVFDWPGTFTAEQEVLFDLIGQLWALGATLDQYPPEPLLSDEIFETVDAFSEHVEKMVRQYIEDGYE